MIYILIGGPATGKGTRSDILSNALDIPHISTGEMLREVSKTNKEIADIMSKGELISDEIITELLGDRISKPDCEKGFILDGYPRTASQIELLDSLLEKFDRKITKVIELTVSDELVFERILGRKECASCGKSYGMNKPAIDGLCDECGGLLVSRSDDTKETLAARLETYKKNAKGILEHYRAVGLLTTLDSSDNPERIIEVATE